MRKKNELKTKVLIAALSIILIIALIIRLAVTDFSYKVFPMDIIGIALRALLISLILYISISIFTGIVLGLFPLDDGVKQSDLKISLANMRDDFKKDKALFVFGLLTMTVFAIIVSVRIFIRDKIKKN